MQRFSTARRYVLERLGAETVAEQCKVIPQGTPWSAEFLLARSDSERVTEKLARAECTLSDLLRPREEATALLLEADADRPKRRDRSRTR